MRSPISRTVSRMKRIELGGDLLARRLGSSPSRISRSAHGLPCAPRPTITAAAPVRREHRLRAGPRGDVAAGDHGHVDELDELGGQRVVGGAGVHLLRRAGVERQRRRAGVDERRADVRHAREPFSRPRRIFTETGTSTASATAATIAARPVGVVEQGRARAGLRHLAHRAAEVDVDDVGAGVLDHPRRLRHQRRLGAEDLHRERVLVGGDPQVAERPLVPVVEPGAADHLRADEPGAEPPSLSAERLHAHARHRREHEARRHLDGPDPPGGMQIDAQNAGKS